MNRVYAVVLSVVLSVAVISPLFRDPPRDSYPLSNYPMFSHRIEAANDVRTVVGIDASGGRVLLSPEAISGSDEVMLAASDVARAVSRGSDATALLCTDVARRVRARGPDEVIRIEVVTDRYDAIEYFGGNEEPGATTVHGVCEVIR